MVVQALPQFINFVSMDVEGLEYDVLQSWPFAKVQVGAWIVEHNNEEPKRTNVIGASSTHATVCRSSLGLC